MPRNSIGQKISWVEDAQGAICNALGMPVAADLARKVVNGIPLWKEEVFSQYLPEFAEVQDRVSAQAFARSKVDELPEGCHCLDLGEWLENNRP